MAKALSLRQTLVFFLCLALLVASALTGTATATAGRGDTQQPGPSYVAGEVLIGWQPGAGPVPYAQRQRGALGSDEASSTFQAAAREIGRATGLLVLDVAPEVGTARLGVRTGSEAAEIARLAALPWVRYAEPNYYAYGAADAVPDVFYPNDPDFPREWNMQRVQAPGAWAATRGSVSFVVAVLDTGVAQGHPEFAGKLLPGWNYITNDPGAEDDDPQSHGTHVTGILAAGFNNGQGVAGLAPDVKVLPLKVLNSSRIGPYSGIAQAIRDAADSSAQVINLSLAGPAASQVLQDAVAYAQARGALIVAAAGNCAQSPANCGGNVNPDIYPAAYPGVLAVSASDRFDNATPYSGYKPYIALAAPGGTETNPVWSTTRTGYGYLSGTSMSTPMASAAAALVWTLRPGATAEEITGILKSTADKVGTDPYSGEPLSYTNGRNDYFGSGRLNVTNAVRWAYPPLLSPDTGVASFLLGGSLQSQSRQIHVVNPSGQAVYWQASVVGTTPWLTVSPTTGIALYESPTELGFKAQRSGLAPGRYAGTVRVQSIYPAGLPSFDVVVQLRIAPTLSQSFLPLVGSALEPAWQDPDAPGSLNRNTISVANDSLVTLALPFPVTFYGATYTSLQVSDNGFVTFGLASLGPARAPSACPGSGTPPNNAVYVLAYDWDPALGGQLVIHQPDARTYVVTWRDVRRAGGTEPQSFQLVITSGSRFRGNYRAVESPLAGIIGTENYDGTAAQQIFCNGAGPQIKGGESVRFETRLPW